MSRSLILILILILIVVVLAVLITMYMCLTRVQTLKFSENSRYMSNPMQGFYTQLDTREPERIPHIAEDGVPLVLLACNLNGYQDRPLDDAKLDELDLSLSTAAEHGLGVIFRAAYGFTEGRDTVEPADLGQVLEHIVQIAPVLNRHSANLLCVQAGMLGPWGEWHSSTLMGENEERRVRVRNTVADVWLKSLDDIITVQLRRPEFIRQSVEAGLPLGRLGFHNDALLASDTDMGTYERGERVRDNELSWVDSQLPHGLFGGEMPHVSDYTGADNAVAEFQKLHLTYLNSRYNEKVLASWQQQQYQGEEALAYIERHMGSRLYLQTADLPQYIPSLSIQIVNCELTLTNTGFAPAQSRLSYYLVFRQGERFYYQNLPSQAVISSENGGVILREQLKLPAMLDAGNSLDIGIWVGYGSPDGNGRTYYLANETDDGAKYDGQTLYFATYRPALAGWFLQS